MMGLVFGEFIEIMEARYTPAIIDRMILESSVAGGGAYTSNRNYPHTELSLLIAALSRLVGRSQREIMRDYGRDLFPKLAASPAMPPHRDPLTLIENVDTIIHPRARIVYEGANPPSVTTRRVDLETLHVTYRSHRPFADLAEGVLHGCGDYFGTPLTIDRLTSPDLETYAEWRVIRA